MVERRRTGRGAGDEVRVSSRSPGRTSVLGIFGSQADIATVAALLLVAAASWAATGWGAEGQMRIGLLTGQADMAREMTGGSMALGVFLGTWTVMMVAMMFPAVAPVVLTFRRWVRQRGRPSTTVAAFMTGYIAVWSAIGIVFYGVLLGLQEVVYFGNATAMRVGGGLLVVAGLYQFSPLKLACLNHCRSPLAVIIQYSQRLGMGHRGPFSVGLVHGTYCLGCCWALMIVLVLLGMMSIAWMATVAAVIFAEKVLSPGRMISRVVGVGLSGVGIWLVAVPATLHQMA